MVFFCLIKTIYGVSLTKLAVNRGIERLERRLGFYPQHSSDSDYNIRRALPTDCWLERRLRTTASHEYARAARSNSQVESSIRRTQDGLAGRSSRVIRPATDAKEYITPIRKTIKKRENKRLDWERYTDKVNSLSKKLKRSDRDNAALARAEEDLAKAADVCFSVHRYLNLANV
jgi:hypothetical protein